MQPLSDDVSGHILSGVSIVVIVLTKAELCFFLFFFVCFVVVLLFCFVFLPVIFLQSFLSLHGRNGISVHVVASFISLLRTLKFLFPCYVRLYHKMGSRKKYETRTSIRMKLSFCFKRQYSLFI